MTVANASFKLPPTVNKADGTPRRVGFELEFSGVSLEETVRSLQAALGGEVTHQTAAEQSLQVDSVGEFGVEIDWSYLKRLAKENNINDQGSDWIQSLSHAAALLVPVEVVCPPIPITDLDILRKVVIALRDAGATGTEESMIAAYGVHINPEIPRLDAATLFSYIKAFCLLQWWLVDAHEVNRTRKISPYIDLYSESYLKRILPKRDPSMEEIIADYLEYNPTRNRALDLLPLLAMIDEKRVREVVNDSKVKSRPTFHYRLPNCQIDHADWSLANSWNTWCVVEELAERRDALESLSLKFMADERPILGVDRSEWVEFIDLWLRDHALV